MNYFRTLLLLTIGAGASFAQTVNLTMQLQFQAPILADVATYWGHQTTGSVGTLASAVEAADTSIQITLPPTQQIVTQTFVAPAVGQTVLIDADAMTITAVSVSGNVATLTVTRNVVPQYPAAAHAQGAAASAMQFATPWVMAADALRKWSSGISQSLGQNSAVYAATATGTVQ